MGLIFGGAYIRRGLCTEINLRFKIDWASPIVGKKITVFVLFYFVFEGTFPSTSHRGGLYLEGRYNGLGLYLKGLIFGILQYSVVEIFLLPHPAGGSYMRMPCHFLTFFWRGHLGLGSGGAGGRDSHIRVTEMPVVSLMGVNCRIWFHLGCLGRKVTILAHLHS